MARATVSAWFGGMSTGFLQFNKILHPDVVAGQVHGGSHHHPQGDLVQIGAIRLTVQVSGPRHEGPLDLPC